MGPKLHQTALALKSEVILDELKSKVIGLEMSVNSCTQRLKKFQKNSRHSLLNQDKKICKLTSKMQLLKSKLKADKAKISRLERKLEGIHVGNGKETPGIQIDDCYSGTSSPEKENDFRPEISCIKGLKRSSSSLQENTSLARSNGIKNQVITTREYSHVSSENQVTKSHTDSEKNSDQHSYRTYACNLCEKIFDTSVALNIHNLYLCPESIETHGCPVCPEYFGNSDLLLDHLKTHNSQSNGTAFVDENSSAVERDEENKEIPYCKNTCRSCGKTFLKTQLFHRHLNIVHPDAAPHRCQKCDTVFSSLVGLRKQETIFKYKKHEGLRIFNCPKCEFFTKRSGNYYRHIKTCNPKAMNCLHCKSTFLSHSFRVKHERLQHPQLFQFYRCSVCSKGFKRLYNKKRHEKLHLYPSNNRCPYCKYFFVKWSDLSEHVKICLSSPSSETSSVNISSIGKGILEESSTKPPVASLEKSANKKEIPISLKLTSKIKKKALKTRKLTPAKNKLPEFTCKTCQKTFAIKRYLVRHEKTHKKIILTTDKQYKCRFCKNISFSKWTEFESHVKTHPESKGSSSVVSTVEIGSPRLKKCKCLLCDKEFAVEDTMFSHFMYAHAWRKPHMCIKCQKSFCTLDGLKRHSKAHVVHDDGDYQSD